MRVQFRTEGGSAYFPGLSRPVTIDSADLPGEEMDELRRLVAAARFFDQPALVGAPPRGAADYQQHTITIEEGGRRHTVRVTDFATDPDLRALLDYLRTKARELRAAARAGDKDQRRNPPS
ncbi:MAG TPA: protealysin inhibitor emfourin [Roseiflexaceae bacterium]|nr:protealysin inhibitor emfourin [Roseiflexaceae bacterium]